MAKEYSTDKTLLAHDKQDDSVKAVKRVDKKGNLKTVAPKQENNSEFLKIDKHGDPVENFISNFKRQLKNPTRFSFFPVRIPLVEKTAEALRKKIQENKTAKQLLNNQSNTNSQKQKSMENTQTSNVEQHYRFNPEKIDWDSLKKFGITKESLSEKTLETMLKGSKSDELHRISADFGSVKLQTEARLGFREMPDGSIALAIHGVRRQPELDKPYFSLHFTEEDRKNLLETGNLGRLVEVKYPKSLEPNLVYISVDKLTNELVAMKAEHIRLPEEIKGVVLSEEQKLNLQEGKAVFVEGMTSKKGTEFSAYIQVNADKRGIEFQFDNTKKNLSTQNELSNEKELLSIVSEHGIAGLHQPEFSKLTETEMNAFLERNQLQPFLKEYKDTIYERENALISDNYDSAKKLEHHMDELSDALKKQAKIQLSSEQPKQQASKVFIPNKMGGVEISKDQQTNLRDGKTIYVENMTDKQGQQYSAYVKVDAEKGKLAFYKDNPDVAQKEGKTQGVKPDSRHKAQVNANNEGKKSEANKKTDESFKKGETHKPKGYKM